MSLNAVQKYMQAELDGLSSGTIPPAQAWVLPPPYTNTAENPQLFIWGGTFTESRHTIPRGQGEKDVRYNLTVWVMWSSPNDITLIADFPVFLDSIAALLRAIPLPVSLTDSTTGAESYLTNLGETMTLSYGTPSASINGALLYHNALFRLPVTEHIMA
jgi:hypothetical protein